jgi:hypothetical protein
MDFSSLPSGRNGAAKLYTVNPTGSRKLKLDVLHYTYVDSNVTERQPVGHTHAPLPGAVPVGDAAPGSRVHYAFNALIYLPVSQAYIRHIRMQLTTEDGGPVPFASASVKVVCCLRFRRKAPGKYQIPFLL